MSEIKSRLYEHARKELELLGEKDLAENLLEIIEVWGKAGHSGSSSEWARAVLHRLLGFENLTALTSNSEEWENVTELNGGILLWQNKRNPAVFSKDAGKTWYQIDKVTKK